MKKLIVSAITIAVILVVTSGSLIAQGQMDHSKMDDGSKKGCCSASNEGGKVCDTQSIDLKSLDKNKDGKIFQCSMCATELSDEASECSKCGMNLNEVSLEDAQKDLDKKSNDMMDHGKMESKKMDHSKMMKNHDHGDMYKKMNKDHKDMNMQMKGMDDKKDSIVREGMIDLHAIDENKDGKVFQDFMDWNVISDEAGICPVCEMKLREVSLGEEKANLNMQNYKVK